MANKLRNLWHVRKRMNWSFPVENPVPCAELCHSPAVIKTSKRKEACNLSQQRGRMSLKICIATRRLQLSNLIPESVGFTVYFNLGNGALKERPQNQRTMASICTKRATKCCKLYHVASDFAGDFVDEVEKKNLVLLNDMIKEFRLVQDEYKSVPVPATAKCDFALTDKFNLQGNIGAAAPLFRIVVPLRNDYIKISINNAGVSILSEGHNELMTRDITEIKEQGFTLLDNTQRKGKKWHGIYSLNKYIWDRTDRNIIVKMSVLRLLSQAQHENRLLTVSVIKG
ncbi:hypothetical protein G5I_06388 [Acromyrmex echinatior]|uniref:Uncharacterized protein n=1 Tax=Acromyrmex echinatior TaxID=103372 RepID=F4WKW8_ACREC|nr:hypothetical protein G5I_06388 [Acromyrmex echinatior]